MPPLSFAVSLLLLTPAHPVVFCVLAAVELEAHNQKEDKALDQDRDAKDLTDFLRKQPQESDFCVEDCQGDLHKQEQAFHLHPKPEFFFSMRYMSGQKFHREPISEGSLPNHFPRFVVFSADPVPGDRKNNLSDHPVGDKISAQKKKK